MMILNHLFDADIEDITIYDLTKITSPLQNQFHIDGQIFLKNYATLKFSATYPEFTQEEIQHESGS